MNGKSRAARASPIGAFVSMTVHFVYVCVCARVRVCMYSSSAVSLFLGLWPEVHCCVANQQKMTGYDQGRTFHIQNPCMVVALLQFSECLLGCE